ncbi:hypothetical protein [Salinarimonas soli]|uniref:Uncharacterized protein n=1 Tax=Salinarimonas soli TaxID=1638099 RepID=A0A5B2VZ37_9HYPH|nr:hypothetical protein [Salinarimonas soli]KAA2244054.1 hypothetical protein F0L46_02070 [Salinarimonas soli]
MICINAGAYKRRDAWRRGRVSGALVVDLPGRPGSIRTNLLAALLSCLDRRSGRVPHELIFPHRSAPEIP